jgi:hypothetical protein
MATTARRARTSTNRTATANHYPAAIGAVIVPRREGPSPLGGSLAVIPTLSIIQRHRRVDGLTAGHDQQSLVVGLDQVRPGHRPTVAHLGLTHAHHC